jgi:hypothetical protein
MLHHVTFVNNLGSQNVLDANEPVLIVRPDDGPIGPKHVALYVLLMVIIDVLDENINTMRLIYRLAQKSLVTRGSIKSLLRHPVYFR